MWLSCPMNDISGVNTVPVARLIRFGVILNTLLIISLFEGYFMFRLQIYAFFRLVTTQRMEFFGNLFAPKVQATSSELVGECFAAVF